MKVLQLASGDLWAGAEVQLFHMASTMHSISKIDIIVVLLNSGQLQDELIKKGIQVLVFDEANLNVLQLVIKLNEIIKQFQPDIIHTHRTKENIIGGISAFISRCKSVRTVHGLSEFNSSLKNIVYSFLDRLSARFFQQCIISVSDELKERLINQFPKSKVVVIPNGVDIAYIENQGKANLELKIDSSQFNICFIGRFVSVKRVDFFYDIAKEFFNDTREENVHFHMIGDGPLLEVFKKRAKQDNLNFGITFTGFIENTAPYLKKMNLLLFTSDNEGLPMTLLEAMALNVAVMTRKHLVTIKKVLLDGQCGFINVSDNPSEISQQIMSVIKDEEKRHNIISLARETVECKYSIAEIVNEYFSLYADIQSK